MVCCWRIFTRQQRFFLLSAGTTVAVTTTIAIATAVVAIAMTTIAVVAAIRTGSIGTRTVAALLLLVAFRLGEEGTVRQAQLAGLLVDLDELHIDLVAFLQARLFHGLVTLPIDLGDVQQTVLVGDDLHEGAEGHDGDDLTVVDLADLRHSDDGFDLGLAGLDVFLVLRCDLHDTFLFVFGDDDDGVGLLLHLLDDLATRADDGTDHILRDIRSRHAAR